MPDSYLAHYGTKFHSGRYPYGSGEVPYQHDPNFLKNYKIYQDSGMSEKEIATAMGFKSTTELRSRYSLETNAFKKERVAQAVKLREKNYSLTAIGEKLGDMFNDGVAYNESTVRGWLTDHTQERVNITTNISNVLKEAVETKKYIDIGTGTENLLSEGSLKVSPQRLKNAVQKLVDEEGYTIHNINIEQSGIPGQYTTMKVLAPPGATIKDVWNNRDQISLVTDYYTPDNGKTILGIEPVKSLDRNRIMVRYDEDGGSAKDGVIEIRRNVDDLSLGSANYAQVRIAVDDKYYMKGMAVYSDDMPPGVDIIYNSNKAKGSPDEKVFKALKTTPDGEIDAKNPFGSTLRMEDGMIVGQSHYIDKEGNSQLSPINIVRQEGDWSTWSKTLASQFLSKQYTSTAKQQLNLTYAERKDQLDEIMSITQPEVKKQLLLSFADECDSAAVHLKAAQLSGQSTKVLLPLTDISDTQCYAPTYRDGDQVALVRYPHAGVFEIPVLTVNNKNKDGQAVMGKQARDAIGINAKVAGQLSGADFDGDSVIVIPLSSAKIKTAKPLEGLSDFNPKDRYPAYEGMSKMTSKQKEQEMGKASNLITDMTLKGASLDELARAVRYSMVVIDAEKHNLNYKQSFVDEGIAELKTKYQGGPNRGASTLISLASSEERVDKRKAARGEGIVNGIDVETGKKVYEPANETYVDAKGKEHIRTIKSTKMYETDDAYSLSSGTPMENLYADYANKMKAMANDARKTAVTITPSKVNKSAKETYASEVSSVNSKLNVALKNKPLERQAQLIANVTESSIFKDNPGMEKDEKKKVRTQALAAARAKVGANKSLTSIQLTDREWEAIEAGAFSSSKVSQILANTDSDKVKALAIPRQTNAISSAKQSRIKALSNANYTLSEIADAVGLSVSTVEKYL